MDISKLETLYTWTDKLFEPCNSDGEHIQTAMTEASTNLNLIFMMAIYLPRKGSDRSANKIP